MGSRGRVVVAQREFATTNRKLALEILSGEGDAPSFEYRFLNGRGDVEASVETFGVDTVQALLFCITAAGDYLRRYVPSASFADLGVSALLTTDLSNPEEWRAEVSMPAVLG